MTNFNYPRYPPQSGYMTESIRTKYIDSAIEKNLLPANAHRLEPVISLVAANDTSKPIQFWQLYSVLGPERIVAIVSQFYNLVYNLKSMAVFAIVVEEKSFRRAALRLSLSPSMISHHITKLEKNLGVALIYRSTRSFSLTDEGQLFYQSAKAMLVAATDGMGELAADSQNVLTQLRVAIPEMLSSSRIFDRVTAFSLQNPGIQLMIKHMSAGT